MTPVKDDEKLAVASQTLTQEEFVLFVGAGVSMSPPAGLPDWHTLRDWTIQAVAARSPTLEPLASKVTTCDMLASPGKKGMTPELVASVISRTCSGYFESLRVLEDGLPNENHHRIALLAKIGLFHYIVTTNFDLFIENALDHHGVPYDSYRTDEEFAKFPLGSDVLPERVSILKIHGCLSEPSSIIATIEKQARGLSGHHLLALKWLQRRRRFVYWGYSGWDLKINLDYLGTVSVADSGPGFIWSLHRDSYYTETPSPYIQELARIYENRALIGHDLVRRSLDPLLVSAGIPVPEPAIYTPDEHASWLADKARKLREGLNSWAIASVHRSEATLIVGDLLEVAGFWEEALTCYTKLIELGKAGGDPSLIAIGHYRSGRVRRDRGQLLLALECFHQAEEVSRSSSDFVMLADILEAQSVLLVNLGFPEQALTRCREARSILNLSGNPDRAALLAENIGMVYEALRQYEEALSFHTQAEQFYRRIGAKHALCGCLNRQGIIFRNWGEFDEALKRFRESLSIARDMIGDRRSTEESRLLIASVEVTRGDSEAAYAELLAVESYARESRASDLLAKVVQYLIIAEHKNGNSERVTHLEDELIRLRREMNDRRGLGSALLLAADRFLQQEQVPKALESCDEALELFRESGDMLGTAIALEKKGEIYQDHLSRPDEAATFFVQSISAHRSVDQDAGQFVPVLLRKIAICQGRSRVMPTALVTEALAQEPLVEEGLQSLYGRNEGTDWSALIAGSVKDSDDLERPIYDLALHLQVLAHKAKDDSRRSIRLLRAASKFASAIGYAQLETMLICDIGWQHVVLREYGEGLPLLEKAANKAAEQDDTDSEILITGNLGFGLARYGNLDRGMAVLQQALSLARSTHNRTRMLWLLRQLAAYFKEERSAAALSFFAEAITLAEEAGDLPLLRDLNFDIGKVYYDTGEFEKSLTHRLRGLELLRITSGTPGELIPRLTVIGALCENKLERIVQAIDYYDEALAYCYRARNTEILKSVLELRQQALGKLKDPGELPHPLFERLCTFFKGEKTATVVLALEAQSVGFPGEMFEPRMFSRLHSAGRSSERAFGQIVVTFALSLQKAGNYELADTELKIAEISALQSQDKQWLASVRRHRADLLAAQELNDAALEKYAEALHIAELAEDHLETELLSYKMAEVELKRDNNEAALVHIQAALACARAAGYLPGVAHDLAKLATILERKGEIDAAAQALTDAIPIFREHNILSSLVGASVHLAQLRLQQLRPQEALSVIGHVKELIQKTGSTQAREALREITNRATKLLEDRVGGDEDKSANGAPVQSS